MLPSHLKNTVLALCVSIFPLAAAEWTFETESHPTEPGQILDIDRDGVPVARFVYGDEQLKPFLHVFGTDGELVTKGDPEGLYHHHRGIFLGWNQISSDQGTHDLWHLTDGTMRVVEVESTTVEDDVATLRFRIEWRAGLDGDGPLLLTEWRTLRISRPEDDRTQVDAHYCLKAERDLELGGDLQHAGAHFRAAQEVVDREGETRFLEDPAGRVEGGAPMNWCRMTFGLGSRWYAVTQFNSPANPVLELSQRPYGRFGYFSKTSLEAGEELKLDYRWIIREIQPETPPDATSDEEEAAIAQATAEWEDFAQELEQDADAADDGTTEE